MLQFLRHHNIKWRTSSITPSFRSDLSRLNHISQPSHPQQKDSRNRSFSIGSSKKNFLQPSEQNPAILRPRESPGSPSGQELESSFECCQFDGSIRYLVDPKEGKCDSIDNRLYAKFSEAFEQISDFGILSELNSASLSKSKDTVVISPEFQIGSSLKRHSTELISINSQFESQLSIHNFTERKKTSLLNEDLTIEKSHPGPHLRSLSSPSTLSSSQIFEKGTQPSFKSLSILSINETNEGDQGMQNYFDEEEEPIPATYSVRYTKEFRELGQLGKGGFGSVFKVQNKFDRTKYAIKKVLVDLGQDNRPSDEESQDPFISRDPEEFSLGLTDVAQNDASSIFSFNGGLTSAAHSHKITPRIPIRSMSTSSCSASHNSHQFSDASVLSPTDAKQAFREVLTMARLKHRNIVRYHQAWLEPVDENLIKRTKNELSSNCSSTSIVPSVSQSQTTSVQNLDFNQNETLSVLPSIENSENSTFQKDTRISMISSTFSHLSSSFRTLYIQMELCCKQTLSEWLTSPVSSSFSSSSSSSSNLSRTTIDPTQNLSILHQILKALAYIHKKGIIHRDLKPSNIFLSQSSKNHRLQIKIGDFGLSTHYERSHSLSESESLLRSALGTSVYASPQQINHQPYGPKTDIFSLGIIVLELYHMFSTQMERLKVLEQVRDSVFPEFESQYPFEASLARSMLLREEKDRPSASELLSSLRTRPSK